MSSALVIRPEGAGALRFRAPCAKSEALRALALMALAGGGELLVSGPLPRDVRVFLRALHALGVSWQETPEGLVVEKGLDLDATAPVALDFADGAAPLRFGLALAARTRRRVTATGSPRLLGRGHGDLVGALSDLGARARGGDGRPIEIRGPIHGGAVAIPTACSSQFTSALLLAGAGLQEGLAITPVGPGVSAGYADLTRAMMAAFGLEVGPDLVVPGATPPRPARWRVGGDWSGGLVLLACAAFVHRPVLVLGLDLQSIQPDREALALAAILGVEVRAAEGGVVGRAAAPRRERILDLSRTPDAVAALVPLAARLTTRIFFVGAAHLSRKESDRRETLCAALRAVGVRSGVIDDGLWVAGPIPSPAGGEPVRIPTEGDHRVAMAAALLGLAVPVAVTDPECVEKSFPDFFDQWPGVERRA